MKSKTLVIRVTSNERERLEEEAKAVNQSMSEYIRFLIFDKRVNDYDLILKRLSSLQDGQQKQLEYLETISLRSKKNLIVTKNLNTKILYLLEKEGYTR